LVMCLGHCVGVLDGGHRVSHSPRLEQARQVGKSRQQWR